MKDWRIEYYSDLCATKINDRIIKYELKRNYADTIYINTQIKIIMKAHPELKKLDAIKLLLQKIKDGEYDKF